jgi:hypothetical protein
MTLLLSQEKVFALSNKIRAAMEQINNQGKAAHYMKIYLLCSGENPDNIGRIIREFKNRPGYWKDWVKGMFYLPGTLFDEWRKRQVGGVVEKSN